MRLALAATLIAVLLVGSSPARTDAGTVFTVDDTEDAVDASPGDGTCATALGTCALRAAIQEANSLPGSDTVSIPSGTYVLSIEGRLEDDGAAGDLDITDDLTIEGAGRDATIIDGNEIDRVIHAHDPFSGLVFDLRVDLRGLTVTGGRTEFVPGSGSSSDGGGVYSGSEVTLVASDVRLVSNHAGSLGQGGGLFHGSTVTDSFLRLERVTIADNTSGGEQRGGAGGIYSLSPTTVIDSEILRNVASGSVGGLEAAQLTMSQTIVADNTAGAVAGGVDASNAVIESSLITGNSVGAGAGGVNAARTFILTDTVIANNRSASGDGGGLRYASGSFDSVALRIERSEISGNESGLRAGGINISTQSRVEITNTTISGNRAGLSPGDNPPGTLDEGGGLFVEAGKVLLTNVTFADNEAPEGSAIYQHPANANAGSVSLVNTLIARTSGTAACAGLPLESLGHNVEEGDSCGLHTLTDIVNADGPGSAEQTFLGPLADNGGPTKTHALGSLDPGLTPGSVAIDGGDATACPSTDQRLQQRPADGDGDGVPLCDIGAFEAAVIPITPVSPNPTPASLPPTGGQPAPKQHTNTREGQARSRTTPRPARTSSRQPNHQQNNI